MDALKPHTKMGVMASGGASDATSHNTSGTIKNKETV